MPSSCLRGGFLRSEGISAIYPAVREPLERKSVALRSAESVAFLTRSFCGVVFCVAGLVFLVPPSAFSFCVSDAVLLCRPLPSRLVCLKAVSVVVLCSQRLPLPVKRLQRCFAPAAACLPACFPETKQTKAVVAVVAALVVESFPADAGSVGLCLFAFSPRVSVVVCS